MSGGPTASGVRGVNTWRSRSVDVGHVVADKEHSNGAVPQYQYRTELVWRIVVATARACTHHWIVPLSYLALT